MRLKATKHTALAFILTGSVMACAPAADQAQIATGQFTDERLSLPASEGRDIPLRLLTPADCDKCPMIIFSHGANAAYDRYDALTLPLARAGYRVAIPNHTDSEEHPNKDAYNQADWTPKRIEDYNVIAASYDTTRLIAAGHSFGALIAQYAGGAKTAESGPIIESTYFADAVLAYSPPGAVPGFIDTEIWQTVSVPMLVTTGTTDIVPMMAENWQAHLDSFNAAPPHLTYALIYNDMDHYMDGAYGREKAPDSNAHAQERNSAMAHMIEASLSFLSDAANGDGPDHKEWALRENDYVTVKAGQN